MYNKLNENSINCEKARSSSNILPIINPIPPNQINPSAKKTLSNDFSTLTKNPMIDAKHFSLSLPFSNHFSHTDLFPRIQSNSPIHLRSLNKFILRSPAPPYTHTHTHTHIHTEEDHLLLLLLLNHHPS